MRICHSLLYQSNILVGELRHPYAVLGKTFGVEVTHKGWINGKSVRRKRVDVQRATFGPLATQLSVAHIVVGIIAHLYKSVIGVGVGVALRSVRGKWLRRQLAQSVVVGIVMRKTEPSG